MISPALPLIRTVTEATLFALSGGLLAALGFKYANWVLERESHKKDAHIPDTWRIVETRLTLNEQWLIIVSVAAVTCATLSAFTQLSPLILILVFPLAATVRGEWGSFLLPDAITIPLLLTAFSLLAHYSDTAFFFYVLVIALILMTSLYVVHRLNLSGGGDIIYIPAVVVASIACSEALGREDAFALFPLMFFLLLPLLFFFHLLLFDTRKVKHEAISLRGETKEKTAAPQTIMKGTIRLAPTTSLALAFSIATIPLLSYINTSYSETASLY